MVVLVVSGWNCPFLSHLNHVGSHTALQFRRENKADSQSTDLPPSAGLQLARQPGGLWCPPQSQNLSETLCGAPRGRCSGPGPWEGGTGWGRTVLGHQQEWQSPLSDPEGTLSGLACSRGFSTHKQPTRPPLSSQDGASKHSWSNGPSRSTSYVPPCPA